MWDINKKIFGTLIKGTWNILMTILGIRFLKKVIKWLLSSGTKNTTDEKWIQGFSNFSRPSNL